MKSEREPGDRKATDRNSQGSTPDSFDPEAFVDDHVWTFAKTMPHIPHEYVVRGKKGCAERDWAWRTGGGRRNTGICFLLVSEVCGEDCRRR